MQWFMESEHNEPKNRIMFTEIVERCVKVCVKHNYSDKSGVKLIFSLEDRFPWCCG